MVLGGRDGTAQPMARGDMEQFQVFLLLVDFKIVTDDHVGQVEDWSWAPVKTKMTLERSYQCAVGLSRSVSGQGESSTSWEYVLYLQWPFGIL